MTLRSSKEEVRDRNEIKKVNNLLITFRAGDQVRFPREKMCEKERRENKTRLKWKEDYFDIQKTCREAASEKIKP